jgi:hypothetical protein
LEQVRANVLNELAAEASLDEGARARLRCRLARRLEGVGAYEEARELLRPFWPRFGERPAVEGLDAETAAELLLRAGVLTNWIGGDARLEHAHEAAKDLVSEGLSLFERLGLVERAAEAQAEAVERGRVAHGELRDLGAQTVAVSREVEMMLLAGPPDPVKRVETSQPDLAMEIEPAGAEGLLEHPRHGQQRRARVPRVAAVAQAVGATSGELASVDDGHLVARALEPKGDAETAEPGADHDDPHRRRARWRARRIVTARYAHGAGGGSAAARTAPARAATDAPLSGSRS